MEENHRIELTKHKNQIKSLQNEKENDRVRLEKFVVYIKHRLANCEMNDAEFTNWITANLSNFITDSFGRELDSLGDFIFEQQQDKLVKSE